MTDLALQWHEAMGSFGDHFKVTMFRFIEGFCLPWVITWTDARGVNYEAWLDHAATVLKCRLVGDHFWLQSITVVNKNMMPRPPINVVRELVRWTDQRQVSKTE